TAEAPALDVASLAEPVASSREAAPPQAPPRAAPGVAGTDGEPLEARPEAVAAELPAVDVAAAPPRRAPSAPPRRPREQLDVALADEPERPDPSAVPRPEPVARADEPL